MTDKKLVFDVVTKNVDTLAEFIHEITRCCENVEDCERCPLEIYGCQKADIVDFLTDGVD